MASLERRLGLFSIITICISSMIGDGIFILPALGFMATGPSLFIAFLISAFCVFPAAVSKAELATAMPTSGGTYVYLERTFGPLAGTIAGLGLFMSILLKASVSLFGIGLYLSFVSNFTDLHVILFFLTIITFLNILGVGKVSSFVTAVLFITLTSVFILCIFAGFNIQPAYYDPLLPNDILGLLSACGILFVAYSGVTKVAAIAEEVKNPERNLPVGILLSLFITTILYSLVSFILVGNFDFQSITNFTEFNQTPIVLRLASSVGGKVFIHIMAIVAVLTMVNTANAGILAGSRFPFAMARDQLIPGFLGKLHKKFLTPVTSILLSGFTIAIILTQLDVIKIAKLASAFMIFIFIIINFSIIVLRESGAQWYKPGYKAPFYPFVQIFGILTGSILLIGIGQLAIFAIIGMAVPGVLIYFFFARKRVSRKGVIGIRGRRTDLTSQPPQEINKHYLGQESEFTTDAEVVIALFGKERSAEMLVEMGISMAQHTSIEVAHILEIPEQTDIHDLIEEPAEMKSVRRRINAMAEDKDENITYDPVVSHDVSRTIFEISQRVHCNWLLVEWRGKARGRFTFDNPIGWLKSHLQCNLAVFKDKGVRYIRKIMVVIHNDKNDKLILKMADHLAKIYLAEVTLMRFAKTSSSDEHKSFEQRYLKELSQQLTAPTRVKVVVGKNQVSSFIAETIEYDLLIMGANEPRLFKRIQGTFKDKMMSRAACSVLAVHESTFIRS
ncbi:MAG: hypothetical protein CME62_05335 [Halobacteriovoraceae bacterium]|nr:hypothetical protein [Halobacteriovoraceae bacterium]|tara:strand:- start:31881 stop:34070 length:2190 start_codon:yes stop_codon:yes gene_type:complete